MDPSDFAPLVTVFPKVAPFLAWVPLVQLAAKLLGPIPGRIAGYSHATVWTRLCDTIAAFPASPAPRPEAPPPVEPAP